MGRLGGFGYREIVRRLKRFGFTCDWQAAIPSWMVGVLHMARCCDAPARLEFAVREARARDGRRTRYARVSAAWNTFEEIHGSFADEHSTL